jgi:hypothetical protein
MKSYNHLFEKLIAYENLDKAIERSSKEKKDRRKVKQVLKNKDKVIKRLQYLLLNQKLKFRKHKVIQINDGSISKKQRLIVKPDYIYEQILHHAIVQVLMPCFLKGCMDIPAVLFLGVAESMVKDILKIYKRKSIKIKI